MRIERPDRIDLHVDGFSSIAVEEGGNAFVEEFRDFTTAIKNGGGDSIGADAVAGLWATALTEAAVLANKKDTSITIVEAPNGTVELMVS